MTRPKTNRPICLDLYCGAGGCSVGYDRAGFHVIGVDIKHQPNYPFEFVQADALTFEIPEWVDFVHASPPCQRYSVGTPDPSKHPDHLPVIREKLEDWGGVWVIENVPGAPMRGDFVLEGYMVGLPLIKRKRLFETSFGGFAMQPTKSYAGPVITVTGNGTPTGTRDTWGRNFGVSEMREAMGIDWMTRTELSQAIPPAYTEFIGRQIIDYIERRAAA